ncbi:response regulator transcription factor [Streptomyces sp. Li-HN-5-11]|uniref:response regulator transcription factor n=1 Tax=Streptomyces sp. Li-HN-5-11 TaxID=3075432 RepID=UPI0028B08BE2|nr:response regulator transcription factor [Streptomyces sp. Li-HN-5-11]WNM35760.1 response regulator transcription factor [Streptomyces sp. Li-HN-5-11]
MHVLLVGSVHDVADSLRPALTRHGYDLIWVRTGKAALDTPAVDMVLLALQLPDLNGLDVCRKLRARSDVPLIVMSSRADETEKITVLELGADDYFAKPFVIRELIARMRALHRRHRGWLTVGEGGVRDTRTVGGRLTFDQEARRVFLDGAEVRLRPKEFDLLTFLAEQPGTVVPRETIMTAVWGGSRSGSTKTVDVHVSALRRKLGDAVAVECVRGLGFRLLLRPGPGAVPDRQDTETQSLTRLGDAPL